jgi:hypothetical protein
MGILIGMLVGLFIGLQFYWFEREIVEIKERHIKSLQGDVKFYVKYTKELEQKLEIGPPDNPKI